MRTWQAVALGAVAVATAPFTAPVVLAIARPFVKSVTKQLLVGYERGRVRLMSWTEELEDVIAEARAEAEDELASWRSDRAAGTPSQREPARAERGPNGAEKPS